MSRKTHRVPPSGAGLGESVPPKVPSRRRLPALISAALVLATVIVYAQVRNHAFVDFDDGPYVYRNPHVMAGLTWKGAAWAFTATHAANWHPLTWLSHMADVELFGMDAGWHHLVNLLLHAANAVILFLALHAMTRAPWPAAFAAAVFAVHPLHVESVAWVAERKDVLSTLFWFLAIWAYAGYARRGGPGRYLLVALLFGLGLLAKPMVVTLPFTLLLMDWWPLARIATHAGPERGTTLRRAVIEKVPLLLMSLLSCAVTLAAQASGGAVLLLARLSAWSRAKNAVVAYAAYLQKAAWPESLAVFYPHEETFHGSIASWKVLLAACVLAAISVLAIRWARRRPYFAVGWLWYLGTLLPVIGLVPIGGHAVADRYTYVPLVGISIMVAWGASEFFRARATPPRAVAIAAALLLSASMAAAWTQARHWRGTTPLFEHAVAVTRDNWLAEYLLGKSLKEERRDDEAMAHLREAVRIFPGYAEAHVTLANLLFEKGRVDEAIGHWRKAAGVNPEMFEARFNLGRALYARGETAEALEHLHAAARLRPDDRFLAAFIRSLPPR